MKDKGLIGVMFQIITNDLQRKQYDKTRVRDQ